MKYYFLAFVLTYGICTEEVMHPGLKAAAGIGLFALAHFMAKATDWAYKKGAESSKAAFGDAEAEAEAAESPQNAS